MTTESEIPQMIDEDRMTGEEIEQAGEGLTGRGRWHQMVRVAEDRAFRRGWEDRVAAEAKEAEEVGEKDCPKCSGSGQLVVAGSEKGGPINEECSRCHGTGKVTWQDPDDGVDVESPEYRRGFDAGVASGADPDDDPMVKCPGCGGTGKMWGYGAQCKQCFGATVVRASTLELAEPSWETAEVGTE